MSQGKTARKKKPRLKIHLQRAWYVAIEDENECEVDNDWCFGTREDAMRDGERMLKDLKADGRYCDQEPVKDND